MLRIEMRVALLACGFAKMLEAPTSIQSKS